MIKLSKVEEKFLKDSGRRLQYEGEFIPVIEVEDKDSLGKLVVLRFLEWVLNHPDGVIALPTGKSPESFIKALKYFKEEWQTPQVQEEFEEHGIVSKEFPDTSNLKFVQIDEYFPINPNDKNSFLHFDKTNYLSILDIKPQNLLTIDATSFSHLSYDDLENLFPEGRVDLSLLQRDTKDEKERLQKDVLLKVDESCKKYEEKIQQWGGIGFCLGGIGLDGHIAFNMSGFSFDSRTRLVKLNYASAAAAAKGFGGIEYSKDKAAITIGLKTITQKKDAIIIIIALGLGKVEIVAKAIEEKKTENIPASVLEGGDGARFCVTKKIA